MEKGGYRWKVVEKNLREYKDFRPRKLSDITTYIYFEKSMSSADVTHSTPPHDTIPGSYFTFSCFSSAMCVTTCSSVVV